MNRPALLRGAGFGRYTVLDPIGHGAMGEVYAAYDPELDRKVALKILDARSETTDPRSRSRLLREAKAIAKLRHPNVVLVHDAGSVDDRVFLAMEYVAGETLAAWLAGRAHACEEILAVFIAAGRGLGAAHAAGLVHRDFKPQNVMVGSDGSVRVTDFGLAREIGAPDPEPTPPATGESDPDLLTRRPDEPEAPLTRTGELVGTPLYMAPEQFKKERTDARTDQFSFCVALYQALYGAHPFGGEGVGELMAAVTAGRLQPPPPKGAVPPWLRRVLLRGLRVDPSERWESMEALLAALSRDPARRRNRILAVGAVIVAFAGLGWELRTPRRAESICRSGPARMAEAWEVDDGRKAARPRRDATRAAFLKTGLSYAGDIWERAARVLDGYAAGWLGMYRDACEATHVRGEQSASVLDLRMACLSDRLQRFRALTDVLADATPTVVGNAVQAATALPGLERCADVEVLRSTVPPPEDPRARSRVEVLRRDLAHVKALGDSGQCTAATTAGQALVGEAKKVGHLPLEGEIMAELGRWGGECTSNEEAIREDRRAALVGLASHDTEVAAQGAILLGSMLADRTPDVVMARDWLDVAEALLQGMSRPHPVLEAWRLGGMARVHQKTGDSDQGLAALERSRQLLEGTYGSEHPDISITLNAIGLVLAESGRRDEALGYYRRAEEVAIKVGGPDHALAATPLFNAAEALNALGRHEEALAASERALAISRRSGQDAFYVAVSLTSLGEALLGLGRVGEAVAKLEQARTLFGNDTSNYPPEVRFALARALWTWPDKRPRALALAREAEAGYQRLGTAATEAAKVDAWLRARGERGKGAESKGAESKAAKAETASKPPPGHERRRRAMIKLDQ
jgi:tetratricopeptide (TPR) repeat protein/tRNA A-37 threonylcarbamoyl transferase component Bud32